MDVKCIHECDGHPEKSNHLDHGSVASADASIYNTYLVLNGDKKTLNRRQKEKHDGIHKINALKSRRIVTTLHFDTPMVIARSDRGLKDEMIEMTKVSREQ